MLFRINAIGLFQKDKSDIVEFNDDINFISGESNTGKSSIGEIIDYCLASSTNIPGVKIAEEPEVYSILLTIDSSTILLGRNKFKDVDFEGNKFIFLKVVKNDFSLADISLDFFDKHKSEYFKKKDFLELEIPKYFSSFPPKTRLDGKSMVRPTIRNMPSFMFQVQDIIKNKNPLFYKMDTGARVKGIKRDFELFLGLVDFDIYNKVNRKNEIIRELKKLENSKSLYEDEIKKEYFNLRSTYHRLFSHLNKNINLESLEDDYFINVENLNELKLEYKIDSNIGKEVEIIRIKENIQSRMVEDLKIELSNMQNQIEHIDTASLKLKSNNEIIYRKSCPICDSPIEEEFEKFKVAKRKILEEKNFLNLYNINFLKEKEIDIKEKLKKEKNILRAYIDSRKKLEDDMKNIKTIQEKENLLNQIKGMIKKGIEDIKKYEKSLSNSTAKKDLEKELKNLEKDLKKADIENRKVEAEYLIGKYSTEMLKTLAFDSNDYGKPNLKFNIENVTAYQQKENGKIYYLADIGSAENNLSFHLSVFLGLHKYIFEHKQSILPSFIFLDQPSQVYFPKAEDFKNGTGDIQKVDTIYKSIIAFIEEMNQTSMFSKIQVIIVDHYYSEEEWYQKYLVEPRWEKDKKMGLIKD